MLSTQVKAKLRETGDEPERRCRPGKKRAICFLLHGPASHKHSHLFATPIQISIQFQSYQAKSSRLRYHGCYLYVFTNLHLSIADNVKTLETLWSLSGGTPRSEKAIISVCPHHCHSEYRLTVTQFRLSPSLGLSLSPFPSLSLSSSLLLSRCLSLMACFIWVT